MARQYSDSIPPSRARLPCLIVDSGSPTASVALALPGGTTTERRLPQRQSSGALLTEVREVLAQAGLKPRDLASLIGLRGPGSFTGLRVGLSMLLGLHEALDIPTTAISTLETLACWPRETVSAGSIVVAAVDAMRGEWFLQPFRRLEGGLAHPLDEPRCLTPDRLSGLAAGAGSGSVVGFAARDLAERAELPTDWRVLEPESLAGSAVSIALQQELDWNVRLVCEPLYLRPPAASRPG